MVGPDFPHYIPASTRQGDDDGYDETMPRSEGLARTYRGRGRDNLTQAQAGMEPSATIQGLEELDG